MRFQNRRFNGGVPIPMLSMEGAEEKVFDGTTKKEKEYSLFVLITDMQDLSKADGTEDQTQWQVTINKDDDHPYGGCIRVREINEGEKYLEVYKVKIPGEKGVDETERLTTKDAFLAMRMLANSGMKKKRHFFDIPSLPGKQWHLDMFYRPEGGFYPWARLELEVETDLSSFPPMPIPFTRIISGNKAQQSQEEVSFIDDLMQNKFILKNECFGDRD